MNSTKPKAINRIITEVSSEKIFATVCFNNSIKLTALETKTHYLSFGRDMCQLITASASYSNFFVAPAIKRGFKYKRSFDIGYFSEEFYFFIIINCFIH